MDKDLTCVFLPNDECEKVVECFLIYCLLYFITAYHRELNERC